MKNVLLALLLTIFTFSVQAQTEEVEKENEFTFLFGGFSKHLKTEKEYNERNLFVGLRYKFYEVGVYNNSYSEISVLAAMHYQEAMVGNDGVKLNLGVRGGLVTYGGYPLLFIQPTASVVLYNTLSVEVSWIPVITNEMMGVLTLNFGYKF